jgi:hypothetical protein
VAAAAACIMPVSDDEVVLSTPTSRTQFKAVELLLNGLGKTEYVELLFNTSFTN